ncbi:MAG: HAMP domain-containing sensor histidine kinase, partial [Patescibacteria group bacterium]|nr:HAMP domain-containing sensor histidine kinase [Patescibacteria group bacterium]
IGFESGLYDKNNITYRVAIPIMEKGILLSVVELGIDTKGILKQISKFFNASRVEKVYIGFLLNDNKLIGKDTLMSSITKKIDFSKLEQTVKIQNKDYFVLWGKEKLKDFNSKKIGTIIYAFDITTLEDKFNRSLILAIMQPLIGMVVVFSILLWLFNYIIRQSRLNNIKISNIVNNQKALIVVTDGKTIIQSNKSFLEFFDIDSSVTFLKDYSCICDRFEKKDGYLQKQNGDKNWLEFMLFNSNTIHKVGMLDADKKLHIFQVNANQFSQDDHAEYIVSFEDITQLEDQLKKNRQKDKQLLEQSRLAQMGEMISMIAHQWRQPLAAISSTSAAIGLKSKLNKLDKDMAIELSSKISSYSQHLSTTIDDFREFFKTNKEKKDITYTEIIDSVLKIIEESIKNKNIKIITKLNCKDTFNTYPNELMQVILNLLKNAEDVLLEHHIENPEIIVETGCGILTVSDNGGGIPEDIMPKIFDPYFSTKTKKDGTGLGLYMSKTIIEEHCGGELSVTNDEVINQDGKPSCGAVFIIKLGENND